jgi:hypothetical protein
MTFESIDAWWWPFLFILVAGWLATDAWRFLGVFLGGRIDENSDALVAVRALATALVAAVIANLVVFPAGALADTPVWLRIGALLFGFACFLGARKNVMVGIVGAEIVLVGGILALT